eukprot:1843570-Amphidinium_carterae.1
MPSQHRCGAQFWDQASNIVHYTLHREGVGHGAAYRYRCGTRASGMSEMEIGVDVRYNFLVNTLTHDTRGQQMLIKHAAEGIETDDRSLNHLCHQNIELLYCSLSWRHLSASTNCSAFSIADLLVVKWNNTTTHSMYVLVIIKLGAEASVTDLAAAISGDLPFPEPFVLKRALPSHDCQYCVQQQSDTELHLIRLFSFDRRAKVADVKTACDNGFVIVLARLKAPTMARIMLQTGFQGLTGSQLLTKGTQPTKSEAEIKNGYDYINRQGPVGSAQHQNLIWAESQSANPDSPIFGWELLSHRESTAQ